MTRARPVDLAVLTPVFRRILESLTLPADGAEPRLYDYEDVIRIQEEAHTAWQSNDAGRTGKLLVRQLQASTDTFLWNVARGHDTPGTVLLFAAEALLSLSNLGVKPEALRAAREVVERARSGEDPSVDDLAAAIRAAEIERIGERPRDEFGLHRALARWALHQAVARDKTGDVGETESLLCDAVDDFLAALGSDSITVEVGAEFRATLAAQGLSREQIGRAVARFERSALLQDLAEAVGRLKDLSFRGGDSGYEHELTSMMVDVADERVAVASFGDTPVRMVSSDELTSVIDARVAHAYSLLSLGDPASARAALATLAQAEASLVKMEAARDATTPLGLVPIEKKVELRGSLSVLAAKLAFHLGDMNEMFARVAQGEAAVAAMLDNSLRANLTLELGELRAIAQGQVPEHRQAGSPPVADAPYDRLRRCHDISNEVRLAVNIGDIQRALTLGAEGLALALSVSPFHQQVAELLLNIALGLDRRMSGQVPVVDGGTTRDSIDRHDLAVWVLCLDAAADVLDARRVLTANETARLSLAETELARHIADAMIEMYAFRVPVPVPEMAIAAAERFRSRILEMDIRARRRMTPRARPAIAAVPTLEALDPQLAVATAAHYVSSQTKALLEAGGEPPPITHDAIGEVAREIGTPVLIVQRLGPTVALLGLAADGQASCVRSPAPTDDWNAAAETMVSRLAAFAPDEPIDGTHGPPAERVLWDAMFEPMKHLWRDGGALIVVPHRDLALLPFGLLRGPDGRTAAERFNLSLSPSLGMLRLLRGRGSLAHRLPQKAVLFGDPNLDRSQSRRFGPLPEAREEVDTIRRRLVGAGVDDRSIALRIGADATEREYRKIAPGADLVHFACHAFLPRNLPAELSHLVLASDPPHDGLLLASEVPDIPLHEALVFLSACESARGQPTADGVLGLGRAFLLAGARAVVMSYFRVHDTVAKVFAGHFYDALLDHDAGRDAAGALREASSRTRRELEAGSVPGVAPHAAHWGAFVVVGD